VVIEGRHFVDLGHRHLHLGGERNEVGGRQTAIPILNLVKVFDQQIATAGRVAEQRAHLFSRLRIDGATFGCRAHT